MFIQENIQLQNLNTMATSSIASWFTVVQNTQDVREALEFCQKQGCEFLVIGEGSNTLFTKDIDKLIIANRIGGAGQIEDLFSSDAIQVISETDETIDLEVGAGVNWHQLVEQSVEQGLSGLEQLALIPGLVGAAPIQNIGAYGSEVKHVLLSVQAMNVETCVLEELSNEECQFEYRDSLFKQNPNDYIITSLHIRLNKQPKEYSLDELYPALQNELQDNKNIDSSAVFEAVCKVRESKLPNPQEIPNTGSFFKNPVVSEDKHVALKQAFKNVISYPSSTLNGSEYKLAAGWLIEQAGFRGEYAESGIGCYEKQALVVVNPQKKLGKEVLEHASLVQEKVSALFGVDLEIEPRVY